MTEENLLIRCPGCGNTNSVAMAVGQQIQCRVCQTYFYSPVLDQGAPPASDSPPPQSSAPSRSPSSEVASGAPTPREEHPASHTWIWTTISLVAGFVIISSSVLLGVHLFREWQAQHPTMDEADAGMAATALTVASAPPVSHSYRWSNAQRSALRLGKLELKVLRVKYGAVTAKDLNNEVINTDDQNLLSINVSVHNRGDATCPFRSWYAGVFTNADGHELLPELVDDQDLPYSLLRFDDVSSIEGQRLASEIEPRQAVRDTVVFLIPPECDRSQIRYFHLTLPAHAIGAEDYFRLEIPVGMIQGFAPTESSK